MVPKLKQHHSSEPYRQLIDDVADHIVGDHGQIMGWPGNYSDHIKRRDQYLAEEAQTTHKLDKKIAQEMHWLARGVTARRKRNQGRLRALHELKAQRAARINRDKQIKISEQGQGPTSQKLIQLKAVSFGYDQALSIVNHKSMLSSDVMVAEKYIN